MLFFVTAFDSDTVNDETQPGDHGLNKVANALNLRAGIFLDC